MQSLLRLEIAFKASKGTMEEERKVLFEMLQVLCEEYKNVNQYV